MNADTQDTGLGKGIGFAVAAALVGALAWAGLTIVTNLQIGFAAIGIGLLVGFAVKASGARHPALPIIAGVVALLGCLLGDVLSDAKALSEAVSDGGGSLGFFTALKEMVQDPGGLGVEVYKAGFSFSTLLFYAFAAGAAYKTTEAAVAAPAPAPYTPAPEAPPAQA